MRLKMAIDVSKIKALCFDVDGTLRDTDDRYTQKFQKFLDNFKFLFPNQNTSKFARWLVMKLETPGNYLFEIPDHLGLDDEIAAFGDFLRRKKKNKEIHQTLIIEGVKETIPKLYEKYPMCVVTARPAYGTYNFLEQHQLFDFFIAVAHGQTTEHTKPYPDPILWCAEKMNCAPSEILMIGDTRPDMKAGKSAGTQLVGVLSGFGEKEELLRFGADLILDDVNQLVDLLLNEKND